MSRLRILVAKSNSYSVGGKSFYHFVDERLFDQFKSDALVAHITDKGFLEIIEELAASRAAKYLKNAHEDAIPLQGVTELIKRTVR